MNSLTLTIGTILTFNLFWALYTTYGKEKIMIRQGEGPLPSTTYGFILLRNLVKIVMYVGVLELVILRYLPLITTPWIIVGAFVVAFAIEILSAFVETIVRAIAFKITYRQDRKGE